jgi:hypothetical protein
VADSLTDSEYQVPAAYLLDLYRKSSSAAPSLPIISAKHTQRGEGTGDQLVTRNKGGDRSLQSPGLLPDDVEIFWKVSAFDNTGQDTTWSINTDWSFFVRIPDAPNPFSLIQPADGDTVRGSPVEAELIWHSTTDPDPLDTLFTYTVTYQRVGGSPITFDVSDDTSFTTPPLEDNTRYTWFVTAEDEGGLTRDSETWTFYTRPPSGIEGPGGESGTIPKVYALSQNYPNPFNPMTTIRFDVPEKAGEGVNVSLEIFSIRGMKVKTMVNNQFMKPGSYTVNWNGRDEHGNHVGSGIYIYRINAGEFTSYRKMVMLK